MQVMQVGDASKKLSSSLGNMKLILEQSTGQPIYLNSRPTQSISESGL